jgi:Ca-activated chloride channel family protein
MVGLGTQSGGPIPLKKSTRGTTYKKDRNGEVVITKRDEKVLAGLIEDLGATYLDGNRTEQALNGIQEFIESGQKADISEEIAIDYEPQFQWFLLPALFFLLLYLMLPTKIGSPFTYGPLVLLLCTQVAWGQSADSTLSPLRTAGTAWEYDQAVNQGKKLQEEGNLQGAAESLLSAVQMNPEGYEGWYNLGSTLLEAGMAEEGESALKESLSNAESDEQISDALYNLGDAAYDAQRYEEALNYYKESLVKNPQRTDAQYNFNRAYEKLQQQQQNQENQEDENQQEQENNEEKEPPKSDKDDPQEKNPEDENSKEKQDQQDQSGEGGDENRDEQENEQGDPKDDKNSEKNEPQQGGESTAKMTPEELKGLLEAIQRAEEKTAEKVTAKKAKGKKKSGEKDW